MSADHEFDEQSDKAADEADLRSVLHEMHDVSLPGTQILVREGSRQVAYKASRQQTQDLRSIESGKLADETTLNGLRIAHRELLVPKFGARYQIYVPKAVGPPVAH